MPQVLLVVLGAIGAALAAKFVAKEWRRINDELDRARAEPAPVDTRDMPVLRPDPETGVYRPNR